MLVFECGILKSEVQPSSMLALKLGSQPARFTMSPIIVGEAMSLEGQKTFERFTLLGPPKFSSVVGIDAYAF